MAKGSNRDLYRNARYNAEGRGIEFLFSFEEWVAWWVEQLGPNWRQKRGPHSNQFHMARPGDTGPYASWNVKCITCAENIAERNTRVRGFGRKWTLAQRINTIAALQGHKTSKKTRAKISASMMGNKNAEGHVTSEETRIKLSIARTGTKASKETRRKMSATQKERWARIKNEALQSS